MDAWSLMRGDAFIHFVCGSRRVNIRLGGLLLIPKSPHPKVYTVQINVIQIVLDHAFALFIQIHLIAFSTVSRIIWIARFLL